jgi:serine-type D-Ala-D-Ala carboxypeptidase (penicillin-binding protein 5/6)
VKEGDKLGSVKVTLKDEVIADKDLIALKSVEKGNIFRRLYDGVMIMIEKPDEK